MSGGVEPEYVLARAALLDALTALEPYREALILVGAQAIYLHTGRADIAIAEFTTDGDLAIDPRCLPKAPPLVETLEAAGFVAGAQLGIWVGRQRTPVDLLVPESLGGGGRRGARLEGHGRTAARKVHGMEAALFDNHEHRLAALADDDDREVLVKVAGPASLLISKVHKISERLVLGTRVKDKDALDVLRLLRVVDLSELAVTLRRLQGEALTKSSTDEAVARIAPLFGRADAPASMMAARAAAPLEPTETTAASCAALASELLHELRALGGDPPP